MTPLEFEEVYQALLPWRAAGGESGAALVTLLRTRGSAFRRAGAVMLVHEDGRVVRGLSAGCPEADIAQQAIDVIRTGKARRVLYDREHAYDVLMESGCGGELEILIEPLTVEGIGPILDTARTMMTARFPGVSLVIHGRNGRCLEKPERLVWSPELHVASESSYSDALRALAERESAQTHAINVTLSATGDTLEVFLQPIQPPLQLVLIGTGAVCQALARQGKALGWKPLIVTHETYHRERSIETIVATPEQMLDRVRLDRRTACIVATHNLHRDIAYLRALRQTLLAYLSAIGARARANTLKAAIEPSATELCSPAGLDIGGETPEEIALSIAAEILARLNRHPGTSLHQTEGPIH